MSRAAAKPSRPSQGRTAPPQHSGRKQVVLAAADVRLLQVQAIDTNGEERSVLVYWCGPDMFWGKSMDDIFLAERRKPAPEWLRTALRDLPLERQFRADGTPYTVPAEIAFGASDAPDAPDILQG